MKKTIVLIFFCLTINGSIAQDKTELLVVKLNKIWREQSKIANETKIYFNRLTGVLDINNYLLKISELDIIYKSTTEKKIAYNFVSFNCQEDTKNCLTDPDNKKISGVGFNFKSKEACYRFIDLIGRLAKSNR